MSHQREFEGYIIDGLARGLWVAAFASWARDVDPAPSLASGTWDEAAPNNASTRSASRQAAQAIAKLLAESNGLGEYPLFAVFDRAIRAARGARVRSPAARQPSSGGRGGATEADLAYAFGRDLASVCLGQAAGGDIAVAVPAGVVIPACHVELDDNGQHLVWEAGVDDQTEKINPGPDGQMIVLLIEDDEELQPKTTRMIKKLYPGAQVIVADNGEAAIADLDSHQFDLVISDVDILGRKSGIDVFHWVQEHQPALVDRYVFFTGNVSAQDVHDRVVLKPAGMKDLKAAIDAPPGAR